MSLLFKFTALSGAEKKLRLQAWGAVLGFRLALWVLPLPRIRQIVQKMAPRAPITPQSPILPAQIGCSVMWASRFVPRSTCLVLALAAQWLLHREHFVSELHVGVVKSENGGLAAHAWVECGGVAVVGGGDLGRYTRILRWEGN